MSESQPENVRPDTESDSVDEVCDVPPVDDMPDSPPDSELSETEVESRLNDLGQAWAEQLPGLGVSELLASFSCEASRDSAEGKSMAAGEESIKVDGPPGEGINDHLEELAEDMLALMCRIRAIEDTQQSLVVSIGELQASSSQSTRTIAREVDTLRRDVLGDRKLSAFVDVFNELIPMIDRLGTMRSHLDDDRDARMLSQLEGVVETLSTCLRRLGCEPFAAAVGTPFDCSRMECDERVLPGEIREVVESVRPGYMFGELVLRPVAVKIGASIAPAEEETGEKCDE